MAMMSRCTSLVPPPNVRISVDAVHALEPAAQERARRAGRTYGLLAEHLHQEPVGLGVELGAEHLGGRRVLRADALASRPRRSSS